jgi:imidazolonepropionase-like amidohydrolase
MTLLSPHSSLALTLVSVALLAGPARAEDLWIDHVTIVSPERGAPLSGATVHIQDGRIATVSDRNPDSPRGSARIIDGTGLFLTPGLIDSHVHLGEIPGMTEEQAAAHSDIARAARDQFPRSYLRFGFTTLIDLNSTPAAIAKWNAHAVRPDTYFCGAAPVLDGYPTNFVPPKVRRSLMPYFLVEPDSKAKDLSADERAAHSPQAIVQRLKSDGAICVKTYFERGFASDRNLPVPQLATIEALVRAAHAVKLPVAMHANSTEAQAFALAAGVDVIAHGLWNWTGQDEATEIQPAIAKVLDGVVTQQRGWQATIQVLYGEKDLFNASFLSNPLLAAVVPAPLLAWYSTKEGQWFRELLAKEIKPLPKGKDGLEHLGASGISHVRKCAAYLAERHAKLLFGSDTPSGPIYANPHGLNGVWELERLAEAGVSLGAIFRAATSANAESFGLSGEIGSVEPGKRANLLLLREDPTRTVHAYATIEKVILHGRVYQVSELEAKRQPAR